MQNLQTAKKRLSEKNLTLSILKDGEVIFENASHGIYGFLEAIEKLGHRLKGSTVADRVAGKAIALLCIYAEVKEVYAVTLSKGAKSVFEKYAVYYEWENLVENILEINKTKICPFEKPVAEISNPKEAYRKLKALQSSLKQCR